METAKNALQELSADPDAQRLAREREAAVLMHRHMLASSFEAGEARGLVAAVQWACRSLGIDVNAERTSLLAHMDAPQLSQLLATLETDRRWPEEL